MDNYTFEDYLKDFELDYLGFDGVPDKPGMEQCSELAPDNESGPDLNNLSDDFNGFGDDFDADIHSPCLRFQK